MWAKFLTYFGKIKILSFNCFPVLVYDPDPFQVTGYDITEIMKLVKPGDVLIRGYNKYLDGKFIPDEKGYSHAGLYIGGNEVIHSVAPRVCVTHLIDFCEADRIMVLRPICGQDEAITIAKSKIDVPYDFDFKSDIGKLYCFELIANCYPQANIQTYTLKKLFGIIKRKCYIAKSIYLNPYFDIVFERNVKNETGARCLWEN